MKDQYEELCARIRSGGGSTQKTAAMKKPKEILNLSAPQITQADVDREIEKLRASKEKP